MTMRLDAYTHFFPKKFFDKLNEVAGDHKDMGKRVRSLPALYDLDFRKKIVDGFKDYQQILSYPQPPIERFAKNPRDIDEFCKIINDGFVELCAKEKDHFPGWVAQVALGAPDAGVREAERAIKELGALGVQIYTNVAGKPIDLPEYAPFWAKMNELGKPVWILNRFDACWRWMADREDSPWYPSVRLFQQMAPGDWAGVVQRVKDELSLLPTAAG